MRSFYTELLSKKKPWTPTLGKTEQLNEGVEEVIAKALAVRILEIPVGEWIQDATIRENNSLFIDAKKLLLSNIEDETKHDVALTMAANSYNITSDRQTKEAGIIANEWINHPDHPLVKAWVIENSVFFVILPIFRMFGDAGLRLISRDISNDETIHVATNRALSKELGYKFSDSLDRLRKKTVDWLVESLDMPGKYGVPQFWLNASDNLLYSGVEKELSGTKSYVMPAFFEHDNGNLAQYY